METPITIDRSAVLAERMLADGRISPALANAALERHGSTGERFEEALLECGLPESMLLRHLAEMFQTKFVSTKTLASASVPRPTLARLPRRLAEKYEVVPIRFASDDTLTVAATAPHDAELMEQVRVAAGARAVQGLVARPAAISAAIEKLYGGEQAAFDALLSGLQGGAGQQPEEATASSPSAASISAINAAEQFLPMLSQPPASSPGEPHSAVAQIPRAELPPSSAKPSLPPPPGAPGAGDWQPSPSSEATGSTSSARADALGDPSGLAESLMMLVERGRGSLKSHSVRVARLAFTLCRELDLSEPQAARAWAAGLFHDLGKTHPHHLTALNVWQLKDHETAARAQYGNPSRLLRGADVPSTVTAAILHMYERYDGGGFPDGLEGERIPYQSRVLALCDTVIDLTLNPNNTLGRVISPIEAANHLRGQTPRVFDPTLLSHFSRLLVAGRLDDVFRSERSVHGIEKLIS